MFEKRTGGLLGYYVVVAFLFHVRIVGRRSEGL